MTHSTGGFTLFEAMVTLAISSVMLVSVVILFNGQQSRTSFNQGIRELEAQLNAIANDVSIGRYAPLPAGKRCDVNGSRASIVNQTPGPIQGTSLSCVYLGKAVHFRESQFDVYTIVGLLSPAATNRSLANSGATVSQDLLDTFNYPNSLRLNSSPNKDAYIYRSTPPASEQNVSPFLMFVNTSGSQDGSQSGARNVALYITSQTDGNPTTAIASSATVASIESYLGSVSTTTHREIKTAENMYVCLNNGVPSGVSRLARGLVIGGSVAGGFSVRTQNDSDGGAC